MSDQTAITFGLAFCVPIGYALIAASGLPRDRARHAAISFFAALGLAAAGYLATGFALQFGGVGLVHDRPGFAGLIWEWSALGPTWGPGWGMAGLTGWGLTGAAATSAAQGLAHAQLPWVLTATMIPVVALRGRIPAWATALVGFLTAFLLYPVAGNWVWGGGWLANLGGNLGLGHGLVDAGGSGSVHLLAAAITLAGLLVFLPRKPRAENAGEPVPLPEAHLPLLALLGAGLLLVGVPVWAVSNPLLAPQAIDAGRIALNNVLAAAAGALLSLAYTWLVAGRPDPLMAARALAAGAIAIAAAAPFVAPWAALLVGGAIGLLLPFAMYLVDRILRWDDPTAVLAVHGLGGAMGVLAVGFLADGTAGLGWNGVGVSTYLGVARQGVTGLLAATGFQSDFPGQLQAQGVGLAALALFGFFAAWLFLAPPAILLHLFQPLAATPGEPPVASLEAEPSAEGEAAVVSSAHDPATAPLSEQGG